ncbi:FAD dependent oxidoreductase [Hysterangium stoloniferum]|nr:FAD dependent oxidoreductase [Hysterangium stoloniferum]
MSSSTQSLQERRIVIIGGGIMGCTSAYYLTRHPQFDMSRMHITLFEASTIAAGASGKAAGLVARWAYPSELGPISFEEHKRLAEEHGGAERWGWRKVSCAQWEGRAGGEHALSAEGTAGAGLHRRTKARGSKLPGDLIWIDEGLTKSYEPLGTPDDTAQVHPYEFTTSMLALAREVAGEQLEVLEGAKVRSIEWKPRRDGSGDAIVGVTYRQKGSHVVCIPADTVILAAGPWSRTILPDLPITSSRSHSIVIEPASPVSPHVLFTSIRYPQYITAPEIYPRPHNRVYASSHPDDEPLPRLASLVQTSATAISDLRRDVTSISAALRNGTVEHEQACYIPFGGPIIGAVDNVQGLIIATGHAVWGICNGPATGKAVAEIVMEGSLGKAWKLANLQPSKFMHK